MTKDPQNKTEPPNKQNKPKKYLKYKWEAHLHKTHTKSVTLKSFVSFWMILVVALEASFDHKFFQCNSTMSMGICIFIRLKSV